MLEVKKPEPGDLMAVLFIGDPIQTVQVVNRIGQYIVLENGLRFHFLDDKIEEKMWKVDNAVIQWL